MIIFFDKKYRKVSNSNKNESPLVINIRLFLIKKKQIELKWLTHKPKNWKFDLGFTIKTLNNIKIYWLQNLKAYHLIEQLILP
jgi:hypothetical protein